MPKKIISFTLSEESIKKVDKTSKALGMSRSGLIEFMLKKGLTFSEDIDTALCDISKLQEETKAKIQRRKTKIC
jgi:hypothetical protein